MNAWAATMSPDPMTRTERLVDPDATPGERNYATLTHLSIAAIHVGMPVIAPLILWLIRRSESPFLDDHGKEAVNFQLSLVIYGLACGALSFCGIGIPLAIGLYIFGLIGSILAATAAHRGEFYRYPMCLRMIT